MGTGGEEQRKSDNETKWVGLEPKGRKRGTEMETDGSKERDWGVSEDTRVMHNAAKVGRSMEGGAETFLFLPHGWCGGCH